MHAVMSPIGLLLICGLFLIASPTFIMLNVMSFWDWADRTDAMSQFIFRIVSSLAFSNLMLLLQITGFGMILVSSSMARRSHKPEPDGEVTPPVSSHPQS